MKETELSFFKKINNNFLKVQKKLPFDISLFLKRINKNNMRMKYNNYVKYKNTDNKLSKFKKKTRKELSKIRSLSLGFKKMLINKENKKKQNLYLKEKYKFLGARYLKRFVLSKRLKLKKVNIALKNFSVNKRNRKYRLSERLRMIFYKKLRKNFKISIIVSKKNKHL